MEFHITHDQAQFQDTILRSLRSIDPSPRRAAVTDGAPRFAPDLWQVLGELGVFGVALPPACGGSGLGLVELALAAESIGHEAAPGPFLSHTVAGLALPEGDPLLPGMASGAVRAAFVTGDIAADAGTLSGTAAKTLGVEDADALIVAAGDAVFRVVPCARTVVAPFESADRTRPLAALRFDAAPARQIDGASAQRLRDAAAVLLAADALGGAQRCLDMTVSYVTTREQFGGPIARFQALKHQLADMALAVEPARALVWYAAYAWDAKLPDASRAASLAKAHLADRFVDVARAAIQAHGGVGYTWDYDLQIWFRRAVFDRAFMGAPSEHRERAAQLAGW